MQSLARSSPRVLMSDMKLAFLADRESFLMSYHINHVIYFCNIYINLLNNHFGNHCYYFGMRRSKLYWWTSKSHMEIRFLKDIPDGNSTARQRHFINLQGFKHHLSCFKQRFRPLNFLTWNLKNQPLEPAGDEPNLETIMASGYVLNSGRVYDLI